MGFYFGKFVVFTHIVIFVHLLNFFFAGCAQHLDYFDELVDLRVSHEGRDAVDHFHQDTASGPHVDLRGVVGGSKN